MALFQLTKGVVGGPFSAQHARFALGEGCDRSSCRYELYMSQRTLSNPFFALVDEAGQVGTRDFARLVDIVEAFEPRELELYKVPVNRCKMVKKPVLLNLPTP